MAARILSHDWSRTPLGPRETWPQSLNTVLRIMLGSRYAMWLGWGPDLVFFCNDAYAPTLGAKQSKALGMPAHEVWAEIWPDIGPRTESVLRTGEATWDEGLLLFLERHGFPEETYHTFSYSPVPEDSGRIGGMLCVVTEETDRLIGERRLRTLRELAASTAAAKSAHDACALAARALEANSNDLPFVLLYLADDDRESARLTASTGIESGHAAPDVVPLDAAGAPVWPLADLLAGHDGLVRDAFPLGGAVHAGPWGDAIRSAMLLPLGQSGSEGEPIGYLVAGISPRRPFDDGYRGFLELVAGQVSSALTEARAYEEQRRRAEALAALDRAKIAFFSNVSHEFRTPLTLMLGPLADLLANHALPHDERELLGTMQRNGQRLLKLVNTLLDFSRIEAGRLRASFEPVELGSVTAELASVFRSALEKAGLRLVLECEPLAEPVFVDRDMWEKIVLNLVSNAFKFTFAGEIRVAVRADAERTVLTVSDTGIGIPEADLPRVFDRFHRVEHARGRTHEGSGIGLALVQELVHLHGGTVAVESTLGHGTTFTVVVPRDAGRTDRVALSTPRPTTASSAQSFVDEALRWLPDAGGAPPRPAARSRAGTVATVLLADDNADMRDYVRRLLADDGYDVVAVGDGVEALDAIRTHRPDLVLTDVMMPRLDGFGLLARLRQDHRTASIPLIMVSARAGEEARVEGLSAGADDYLIKPFSAKELLARVSGTLRLARARHDALSREARLHAETTSVLDSITDGFIALDAALRCTRVNPQGERLLGAPRAHLLGRTPFEPFPEVVGSEIDHLLRRVLGSRQAEKIETWFTPWSRWFELDVYPASDGGLAVYFRDVSERKATVEALHDADRRKDEFLALLAHELRNPLAPLRNGLEVLRLAGGDARAAADARAMMERQLFHLVRLVDDLLDISRITRNKLELRREHIALADVVSTALETARPAIEAAGHDLTVRLPAEPLVLDADLTRLAQVLSNLLINSAKYTTARGRITLLAERDGDEVRVSVQDSGIGIPSAALPSIFDMFSQADRSAGGSGGLGIGLAIVKGLVEMHDGRVEAHSDGPGTGSTFTIHLPLPAGELGRRRPGDLEGHRPAAGRSMRVLVVDDNADSAESMRMMLTLLGYDTRTAHDGVSAVAAAEAFRPEVVFMDIGMPRLNGLEATRRIRSEPWGRGMVIIAVTGWGQEVDQLSSKQAGCDGHLIKPVDPASLETLLATYGASVAATGAAP